VVLTGAAVGAAVGAVQGVAESVSKATGIEKESEKPVEATAPTDEIEETKEEVAAKQEQNYDA